MKTLTLIKNNFLFWLSRKIDYPLLPPDVVQINFTFRCNLSCKMCNMEEQGKLLSSQGRQTEIDSVTFKKIINETKELGTKTILFIGGEPFVRKDLFELVRYTKDIGINPIIVTNGTLLNKENIIKCIESGVDWISVSIDASSEERFSKIRGAGVLGVILKNLDIFENIRKERNIEYPKMVAVCTIMNDNLEELMDIVNLAKQHSIARVLFQPVVANNIDQTQRSKVFPGLIPKERIPLLEKVLDQLIEYKCSSDENSDFIGNSLKHLRLMKKYFCGTSRPNDLPCYAGFNRLQIVQEGKLYFCVNQKKYEAAFGDIKRESIKELWYSKKAKFYRKLIRKCKSPCLQLCSYRDDFVVLEELAKRYFHKIWIKK